jgi:septal ring factor EnvC (AmiA/AmiB activator)
VSTGTTPASPAPGTTPRAATRVAWTPTPSSTAIITALAGFYRDQHDLIADAITAAQATHQAGQDSKRAELAAAERDLARSSAAIDRYLAAFENGTLEAEDLAERLAQLKARSLQLRARRDQLAGQVAALLAASAVTSPEACGTN